MHTYRQSGKDEEKLFTVGYWNEGKWYALRDFKNEKQAVYFTNYLNGGNPNLPLDVFDIAGSIE